MAVPPTSAVQAKKRKHPPTFQHLPRDRALKLKKLWVEKTKLKSQWKAQKRREGLDSGWSQLRISRQQDSAAEALDDEESHDEEPPDDEPGSEKSSSDAEGTSESVEHDGPAPKKARTARKDEQHQHQHHLSVKSKFKGKGKGKGKEPIHSTSLQNNAPPEDDKDDKDDKPSLRELTRQAYSRESLHTFKADPLHRRKDSNQRGRLRGGGQGESGRRGGGREGGGSARESRGDRGRGSIRGRGAGGPTRGGHGGHATGRGDRIGGEHEVRGQPNMKLRMEAMLERIKRDYS